MPATYSEIVLGSEFRWKIHWLVFLYYSFNFFIILDIFKIKDFKITEMKIWLSNRFFLKKKKKGEERKKERKFSSRERVCKSRVPALPGWPWIWPQLPHLYILSFSLPLRKNGATPSPVAGQFPCAPESQIQIPCWEASDRTRAPLQGKPRGWTGAGYGPCLREAHSPAGTQVQMKSSDEILSGAHRPVAVQKCTPKPSPCGS